MARSKSPLRLEIVHYLNGTCLREKQGFSGETVARIQCQCMRFNLAALKMMMTTSAPINKAVAEPHATKLVEAETAPVASVSSVTEPEQAV